MLARLIRKLRALAAPTPAELSVLDAYARWAPNYPAEAHNPFMQVEQQALLDLLPDVAGAIVLDLACGTGRYARIVRARGAAAAIGLDLSPEMLQRAGGAPTAVVRGDLAALPFKGGVAGVVICGLAVGHLARLDGALGEIGRVLAPGGTVVYSDFHPATYRAGRRRTFEADGHVFAVEHHAHLLPVHQAACRAAGLAIEELREAGRDEDGLPAVLVIRARKS